MHVALLLLVSLDVHVTSGGKPAVARVYITDAAGKSYRIPDSVGYSRRRETHSIVEDHAAIALPPGRYTVRAEKGTEFGVAETTIELTDKLVRVDLDVPRLFDMNSAGWYSGDLHIHRAPGEMALLMRAEELSVGPTITRHVGGPRPAPQPFAAIHLKAIDATHVISFQNQEVERLQKGHGAVILLNTPEPVEGNLSDLFPMDVEFCRSAHRQGGFVDGEKPIWKNVPVNVALGELDSIGVVNNHFHPHDTMLDAETYGSMERDRPEYKTPEGFAHWMMDLYYSFLNCGFRLPVSAGSASGVMPSWIGYERVYVRVTGRFSYDQWFRDLKAGHSFATNGPLMLIDVNGKPPGEAFAWTGQTDVTLTVNVHSRDPIDRMEVVYNGLVVRTFKGPNATTISAKVPISSPGWLVVRCFEQPSGQAFRFAHSSPFYFLKDGRLPAHEPDARRWADYVHALAAAANAADYPSRRDYEKAQETFREAEAVYRELSH